MNILLVNDDGINEKAMHILAKKLTKYGNVTICVPDCGRSGSSHSITLHQPITFKYEKEINNMRCYSISSTPADCVRMATNILGISFDVVISGINNGLNLGTDIIYSGTVAAAMEGHILGFKSIAISMDVDCYNMIEQEIDSLLEFIFVNDLPSKEYILNINFPSKDFSFSKGIKIGTMGVKKFKSSFKKIADDRYIESDFQISYDSNPDTDVNLCKNGFISIVPLQLEQTAHDFVNKLKNIVKK